MLKEKDTYLHAIRILGGILIPFVIYYLVYFLALIGLTSLVITILQGEGEAWSNLALEQETTVNAVIGGFAMLLGIVPLVPAFRREIDSEGQNSRQEAYAGGGVRHTAGLKEHPRLIRLLITLMLAITSSVAVNILFIQLHLTESSEAYAQTADRQYSVIFLFGLFLYGIISPLAEEVVFRGIIYNRMKKHFPLLLSMVLSALLFGLYHGNFVQAAYGFFMGMLIAYTYEKFRCFLYAFLFHAAANVAVYTITGSPGLYGVIITPYSGVICMIISIVLLFFMKKDRFRG